MPFVLWNICFCFSCWSFIPSRFPAGALLCASVEHLLHRLFPHVLPLPHHFPSLSCPFFSFALQRPSHLLLPNLFYCSFFFSSPPCFVASPWAVPCSLVTPCVSDGLPRAGHAVGLASTCFCSWCVNPEGTFGV